ncbi:MAG TPA: S8 family peptidase [Clostridiales bacterium]|jgi:subtilisin family serine protease|nr:S8 family peptidase [Clostridiales bacterium]
MNSNLNDYINSPENQELLSRLLLDPDTIDFVMRRNPFFENCVLQNDIAIAKVLGGRYLMAYTTQEMFESFRSILGSGVVSISSIVLGLLDRPSLEASGIIQVQEQPFLQLRGQGVLIGFVDTGIDYTLDCFKYEDGTSKIRYIYDLTAIGPPPPGYYVGVEYTQEQINAALASNDPYSIVPSFDTSGHGTYLASVAAGREVGDFVGAAPDAEIIAVKLRRARPFYLNHFSVPEDQEHAYESSDVMLGVDYILDRARQLQRPVAICIALGSNYGSHDEFSIFAEYLSSVANLNGVCLCVACGNESQARHHMQGVISSAGEIQNIDIRVGANAGDVYLSLWTEVADRVSVSVRSPTGELVGRIQSIAGLSVRSDLILERSSVLVSYFFPVEGTGGQLTVINILDATPGVWTVTVYGDIILNGVFHCWLPMTGFVDPSVEFLAANPYYSVTVPSTMLGAITCGAFNTLQGSFYSQSSWGPTRTANIDPDLVAPGVGVGGFFPYGYGSMDGTSVATAITTGACALMLQWGIINGNDPSMSSYQIRAYLIRGCTRTEARTYPNNQTGYGTLNLRQSFNLMRQI